VILKTIDAVRCPYNLHCSKIPPPGSFNHG
jgi:hypothetical protein